MSQSLLGSLISLSYCCSWLSLIVFRYCFAKRLKRKYSNTYCFTRAILTSLYLNHNLTDQATMSAKSMHKPTQTWAKCNSPACPSSGSHTADVASWLQWARQSSPPMVAEGSQSGHPLCPLVHLLGTHEQTPAPWLLVSKLPDIPLSPAKKKAAV